MRLDERVVTREALAAADDFSVAFRRDHVEAERKFRPLGIGGHVEGLHGGGVAMNDHGLVEFFREDGFFIAAEIVAPFRGIAGVLQNFDGVVVADARKRRRDFFELRNVALKSGEFARAILHRGLHDSADEAFAELNHVFEMRVGGFGLEHPEFGEVAASLGFFGAERGAEAVDLAERGGGGFDIKLRRTA